MTDLDIDLRLRVLRDLARGEGATIARADRLSEAELDAFRVTGGAEFYKHLRRAASLLPLTASGYAIMWALNIQDNPELPDTLEGRRRKTEHWQASDYRTIVRRERRGAQELDVILEGVIDRDLEGARWADVYASWRKLTYVLVESRTLMFLPVPFERMPS